MRLIWIILIIILLTYTNSLLAGCRGPRCETYHANRWDLMIHYESLRDSGKKRIVKGIPKFTLTVSAAGACYHKIKNVKVYRNDTLVAVDSLSFEWAISLSINEIPGIYTVNAEWHYGGKQNCSWEFEFLPQPVAEIDTTIASETAIQETGKDPNQDFLIFPNPATDFFYLQNEADKIKNVKIYDLNGIIIGYYEIDGISVQIPIQSYPKGIFLIRVTTLSNRLIVKKLTIP